LPGFDIEAFAATCKQAMEASDDRHKAASACLKQAMAESSPEEIVSILDAAIPPGADIGEMIVQQSPELTLLYGRIPPRFQSGIHNHTVFACIGQLIGQEKNVFYMRHPRTGLRQTGGITTEPGFVLNLKPDAIHSIENPGTETSSALHLYGGDFRAVMDERSLWTSTGFEEISFSFPALMRESVLAMKRDGNTAGLEAAVVAVPALKELVDGLGT